MGIATEKMSENAQCWEAIPRIKPAPKEKEKVTVGRFSPVHSSRSVNNCTVGRVSVTLLFWVVWNVRSPPKVQR